MKPLGITKRGAKEIKSQLKEMSISKISFSGFYDKNNNPINEGDIVRFYWDADYGYGDEKNGFTEMIDVCYKKGKKYFLLSDIGFSALVSRHNNHSEVIGSIYKRAELLKEFSPELLSEIFPKINFANVVLDEIDVKEVV